MLKQTYLKYVGNDSHVWFFPGHETMVTTGSYRFKINDNDLDEPVPVVVKGKKVRK